MKRLRNEQMIKTPVSLNNRTSSTTESETDLKVPYGEVDQRHKIEPESDAAQLRQPIKNSLVLFHVITIRLNTGLFKFGLDNYLTNVARVKMRYWG